MLLMGLTAPVVPVIDNASAAVHHLSLEENLIKIQKFCFPCTILGTAFKFDTCMFITELHDGVCK